MSFDTLPEFVYSDIVPIEKYETFANDIRRPDHFEDEDWQTRYAKLIYSEWLEFEVQHGPVNLLLTPEERRPVDWQEQLKPYPELRELALDELSDMLWFDVMIAHHLGEKPADLAAKSLDTITNGSSIDLTSFQDIEAAAIAHATDIKEPSIKASLEGKKVDISIEQNPSFVFGLQTGRLMGSLERASEEGASQAELGRAVGDHILAIAYVSKECLHMDLQDLARYNAYKLVHRKLFGKTTGHLLK